MRFCEPWSRVRWGLILLAGMKYWLTYCHCERECFQVQQTRDFHISSIRQSDKTEVSYKSLNSGETLPMESHPKLNCEVNRVGSARHGRSVEGKRANFQQGCDEPPQLGQLHGRNRTKLLSTTQSNEVGNEIYGSSIWGSRVLVYLESQ